MHNAAESPRSGHYRKGITRERYEPATVRVESKSAKAARLLSTHADLCDEARRLQGDPASAEYIAGVSAELDQVEAQIRALGFRAPARSYRVS